MGANNKIRLIETKEKKTKGKIEPKGEQNLKNHLPILREADRKRRKPLTAVERIKLQPTRSKKLGGKKR